MLDWATGDWTPDEYGEEREDGEERSENSDGEEDPAVTLKKVRAAEHAKYLALPARVPPSLVGTYIIDCAQIENGWDDADDLRLSITGTSLPSIYQAAFDFGIIEGAMMLAHDRKPLSYFSEETMEEIEIAESGQRAPVKLESGSEIEDEASKADGDSDDQRLPGRGMKRKAPAVTNHPSKATKPSPASNTGAGLTLHLCMRSRDKGSGEIDPRPSMGSISFNERLTEFNGTVDIDVVGKDVPFRGRKISDTLEKTARWEGYGYAAAEYASMARWR